MMHWLEYCLASHQCGPGLIPGLGVRCGLSLLLVLVLALRSFSPGTTLSPSPQKPTFLNSNFNLDTVDKEATLWMCYCYFPFIYCIYLFNIYLMLQDKLCNHYAVFKFLIWHMYSVLFLLFSNIAGQAFPPFGIHSSQGS